MCIKHIFYFKLGQVLWYSYFPVLWEYLIDPQAPHVYYSAIHILILSQTVHYPIIINLFFKNKTDLLASL